MKKLLLTPCALAVILAGCGGGGNDSNGSAAAPAASGTSQVTATGSGSTGSGSTGAGASGAGSSGMTNTGSSTAPDTTYSGFNYLADLDGSKSYTATFVDKGVGNVGSLTFGAQPRTITMTPLADGGISYGPPIVSGVNKSSNTAVPDLPVVSMLCQDGATLTPAANPGKKSTDVLVANSATRLTSAVDLANTRFPVSYEDCTLGGASSDYPLMTISFDASGNATVVDATPPASTRSFTAAQVSAALTGTPIFESSMGSYTEFFAYRFAKMDGSVGYAIVEKKSPTKTGLTRGVVAIFTQS
jgi:hypothetical protein